MAKADFEKVTIRLTRGAKERINELYPNIGYNKVIRTIVDNFVKKIEERINQNNTCDQMEIEMEDPEYAD